MLNVQDFMDLYLDGLFATIELWDCDWCQTIYKGVYSDMPLKFEYATVESFNLAVDNSDAILVLNVSI